MVDKFRQSHICHDKFYYSLLNTDIRWVKTILAVIADEYSATHCDTGKQANKMLKWLNPPYTFHHVFFWGYTKAACNDTTAYRGGIVLCMYVQIFMFAQQLTA